MAAARAGETVTEGKYTERQTVGEAVMHSLLGTRPVQFETAEAKKRGLAAEVYQRQQAALTFLREISDRYATHSQANPRLGRIHSQDMATVSRELQEARDYLQQLVSAGTNVDHDGQLTADGRRRIEEQASYVNALLAHLNTLVEQQRREQEALKALAPQVPAPRAD
jgi:hypothetical protein